MGGALGCSAPTSMLASAGRDLCMQFRHRSGRKAVVGDLRKRMALVVRYLLRYRRCRCPFCGGCSTGGVGGEEECYGMWTSSAASRAMAGAGEALLSGHR